LAGDVASAQQPTQPIRTIQSRPICNLSAERRVPRRMIRTLRTGDLRWATLGWNASISVRLLLICVLLRYPVAPSLQILFLCPLVCSATCTDPMNLREFWTGIQLCSSVGFAKRLPPWYSSPHHRQLGTKFGISFVILRPRFSHHRKAATDR
jgi:hypothetical protein